MPETKSDQLIAAYKAEWRTLVDLALEMRSGQTPDLAEIARQAKKNHKTVVAKIAAIIGALESGVTVDEIIERGEHEILSKKATERAAAADTLVSMNFRVPPTVRDSVYSMLDRWMAAAGLTKREDVWDLLVSVANDPGICSDEAIRQLAGEGKR